MDLYERILDQKLNQAELNATENIDVTTSDFYEYIVKHDIDDKTPLPPSPSKTVTFPVANMTSSRSSSPQNPYQATVEDCHSDDSDSTLTEPEPKEPISVLKDTSNPLYSQKRKPAKVRFSRRPPPPVVVIQPPEKEKQNSSRPLNREKDKRGQFSTADVKWGRLFDDRGRPTDRLGRVYRGIGTYLATHYLGSLSQESSHEATVLRLSTLRNFFTRFPGNPRPNEPLEILNRFYQEIEVFFRTTKAEYHLVPDVEGGLAHEPALTARGFAEMMLIFTRINPEQEVARLNELLKELPVEAKLHPDGTVERLPKQISRCLFPAEGDQRLRWRVLEKPRLPAAAQDFSTVHRALTPFYGPHPGAWAQSYDPAYRQQLRPYQPYPTPEYRQPPSHWQPTWEPESRPNRYDNSNRYVPVSSSSSSSDSDSSPPSPKSSSRQRHRERTRSPSPPPRRYRRNSSPPRRVSSSSRPRRHSDVISAPKHSSGLWGSLAALTLHPRHAERYSNERREERREREREERRRRSYEPSPNEDHRRREYVYYSEGRGSRSSEMEGVPRSERDRSRVEGARRRDGAREGFAPKW